MHYVCRVIMPAGEKRVCVRDTLGNARKVYTYQYGSCAFSMWYQGYQMVHTAEGVWVGIIQKQVHTNGPLRGATTPIEAGPNGSDPAM